jgi:hypothetical protein
VGEIETQVEIIMPAVSVIICTHNPRLAYLDRVMAGLRNQTLDKSAWELLVIDNASEMALAGQLDLTWHPCAKCVCEGNLGLTHARLTGIGAAATDLLVFIDDDNVLDSDYLQAAVDIGREWPVMGAWGGQIRPEFELPPPDWTKPYWGSLAIREFKADRWSNFSYPNESNPCGAGLVIRSKVAATYAENVARDPLRLSLDRKGSCLTSCGDGDMALTACDLGLGTGLFTRLRLTHLIPANRLTEAYLLRLEEGMAFSGAVLHSLRGRPPKPRNVSERIMAWVGGLKRTKQSRQFRAARWRGHEEACRLLLAAKPGADV